MPMAKKPAQTLKHSTVFVPGAKGQLSFFPLTPWDVRIRLFTDNNLPKEEQEVFERCIGFCLKRIRFNTTKPLALKIVFSKRLPPVIKKKQTTDDGKAVIARTVTTGHAQRTKDNKDYMIFLYRQPFLMMIRAFIHEMQHIAQYHNGLSLLVRGTASTGTIAGYKQYQETAHEHEARETEMRLFDEFLDDNAQFFVLQERQPYLVCLLRRWFAKKKQKVLDFILRTCFNRRAPAMEREKGHADAS